MIIRKACYNDIDGVAGIYDRIHTAEENGEAVIGWKRGIYPERETAQLAVERGDLFVMKVDDRLIGTAIINQKQVDVYEGAAWKHEAADDQIMVLHTLVIDPGENGKGYGSDFVKFYEQYALENGCKYLRMDTNEINTRARAFYKQHGYEEIAIVPCVFNGLENVQLVLLEKNLL